jgi:hypothetical protein
LSVAADNPRRAPTSLRTDLVAAARVLATASLVGAVSGAFVVGVLGRAAMALLAGLNPAASGVTSDDGFVMGQFTLSGSLQLVGAGVQLGVIGAAVYVAVRGLMFGPSWFRLLSMSLAPGVVVGAVIVHTDGVDFVLLEPVWLAVGLFIALPSIFCGLVHLWCQRALADGGVQARWLLVCGLVLSVIVAIPMLVGFLGLRALRKLDAGRGFLWAPWSAWVLRAGFVAVFGWAVLDLVVDVDELTDPLRLISSR